MLMGEIFAVLTGDLVESKRLSTEQLDQVRANLRAAADEVKRWKRGLMRGTPEFFRGDAWQILLTDPKLALRVALFLRTSLLSGNLGDTRVVIGLGKVERVNTKRISLSTGQAFTLSGRELDKLTQYFRMSIVLPEEARVLGDWLRIVGHLCDMLIGHWTSRQAEIIRAALALDDPTQAEVAERLDPPVTKQAVTKALAGADWQGLRSALRQFEKTDWTKICLQSTLGTTNNSCLTLDNQKRLSEASNG
jgi:hypothetical protein